MKIDLNLDMASSASAADWVKKSRVKELDAKAEAKRLAELKQRQLEEEEDELVEQSRSLYSSSDLRGLKVMHSTNDFEEGEQVILTLADSDILERDEDGKVIGINEEGDVLENVLLADKDRRVEREQKKRRLNQPIYSALDDYEFQDGVATGSRAPLLPQYEKEKKAQAKFELGAGGVAAFDPSVSSNRVENPIKAQALVSAVKEASDYYTAKEFTAFSKSKQGRDKKNKAYRKKDAGEDETDRAVEDSGVIESKSMEVDDDTESKPVVPRVVAPIQFKSIDLDEDDPDMVQALARSRRLALQKRAREDEMQTDGRDAPNVASAQDRGAEFARAMAAKYKDNIAIKTEHNEDDDDINVDGRRNDGTLVFNSTTEFATRLQAHLSDKARAKTEALMRNLERSADQPTSSSNRENGADGAPSSASKRPPAENHQSSAALESKDNDDEDADADFAGLSDMEGSDMEVDSDEDHSDHEAQEGEEGDEQLDFVHRQPLVGKGMAATLALLKGTGELKKFDQLAGRSKDSRAYDPSSTDHGVKLEYRDEFGRKLTQKEAFRQLSYKFHGYGPSQKKKEKRLKALELQQKAQSSRAGILEGVGGTMKSLTQAQEATGRAHITIQGGATGSTIAPLQLAAMMAHTKKSGAGSSSSVKK
eukprot:gene21690-24597_t